MELQDFVQNFAAQFDETDASEFTGTTEFKKLGEWSSILALAIIAMVDEVYNAQIKGDDIRNSVTIEDLFKVVKNRI